MSKPTRNDLAISTAFDAHAAAIHDLSHALNTPGCPNYRLHIMGVAVVSTWRALLWRLPARRSAPRWSEQPSRVLH